MKPDPEIQPADRETRRRALRWLGPTAGVGLVLAAGLTASRRRLEEVADLSLVYGLWGALVVIAALMLVPIWWLWRSGRLASQERRFPSADALVVRDTRVYRGEGAILRGRLLQALAVSLAAFVVLTPLAIGWLIIDLGP